MTASFDTLVALDARLQRAGIHGLTPWWSEQLRTFYGHPSAKNLVARVGRGGAKSHTSVKVGLNETLNGDWPVPPGEVHYWAQVSESKVEAAERFRLYEAALTALGIGYEKSGDAIIIPSLRRGVRVMACQVGAVSGFRCFGYAADEAAKWENADHNANPAQEVVASIDAMTVTHPAARGILVSSPLATVDYHYEQFALGNTETQLVAWAPSWVANPGVSEAQCRAKSRGNNRVFEREYRAIPQEAACSAFESDLIDAAFRDDPTGKLCRPILSLDPSGGHGDSFTWSTVQWCLPVEGHPVLVVNQLDSVDGEFYGRTPLDSIISRAAKRAKDDGATLAVSDAREELALHAGFTRLAVRYHRIPWNNSNKAEAVARLRRLLSERAIVFCPSDVELKKELYGFVEKILPSGLITYGARRNGHDDRVAVILTALMAEQEGLLPGSPIADRHRAASMATATRAPRLDDGSPGKVTSHGFAITEGDEHRVCVSELVDASREAAAERRARIFDDTFDE